MVYRHWLAGAGLLAVHADPALRAALKPEAVFEVDGLLNGIDGGGPLTAAAVYRASVVRTSMYHAFRRFFDDHDFAVLPTAQVFPFDVSLHWPAAIAGVEMSSYHRWMEVTAIGTLINAPVLAIPAGFSSSGLPIGLQIIAGNHAEAALLQLARSWERETRWVQRVTPRILHSWPTRGDREPRPTAG